MNINDVESVVMYPPNLLQAIFTHQREIMVHYHKIEHANGLLQTPDVPVDLHDRFGQARLKDFMWRFTEELGEAYDAYLIDDTHCKEEMADALHFLVELCILSGYAPPPEHDIMYYTRAMDSPIDFMDSIGSLTMAGNCLKQKPWKQTHQLTDIPRYLNCLEKTLVNFFTLARYLVISPEELYDLYFRKNQVNKFRIRSKY